MAGILAEGTRVPLAGIDQQVKRSQPDARRFTMLSVQLALLLLAVKVYQLEQPEFFLLTCLVFGGFAVSYWLPFRFKKTFFILLSLSGAYLLLSPLMATLLIGLGLAMFAIVRSGLSFRWRLLMFLGLAGVLGYSRVTGAFLIPKEFWPVFGGIFMFRMIVYMYDLRHMRGTPSLEDYLSYFFLLPNYYFSMFPVIDFQMFRKCYFARDIHVVAEQGVWWIFRGITHLLLYRVIYQLQGKMVAPVYSVPVAVVAQIVLCYLLYLRVSGQFHIITGMLHLFGFDLPETNRRYLLASGMNDYWRRVNIYWKDFMVKVVYFPSYFQLRKRGDVTARLVSTSMVFLVTWFLHGFQFFWVQGRFRFTLNDTIFWIILGSAAVTETWFDLKKPKTVPQTGWQPRLRHALQVVLFFAFISTVWSMWSADSLGDWLTFLKTGTT